MRNQKVETVVYFIIGKPAHRSRRTRPPGGGVRGGVIAAIGGIGNIRMLSSASAPSRVPHVV